MPQKFGQTWWGQQWLNAFNGIDSGNRLPRGARYARNGSVAGIAIKSRGIEVVLFNHALSPSQERNLEKALCCRVLDRTGLILDIFAQRARTHEGKLQVELAQLQHMSTRLVRGWTHLERQKGGIGLRGPGETQLETDRRLLRARIKSITVSHTPVVPSLRTKSTSPKKRPSCLSASSTLGVINGVWSERSG